MPRTFLFIHYVELQVLIHFFYNNPESNIYTYANTTQTYRIIRHPSRFRFVLASILPTRIDANLFTGGCSMAQYHCHMVFTRRVGRPSSLGYGHALVLVHGRSLYAFCFLQVSGVRKQVAHISQDTEEVSNLVYPGYGGAGQSTQLRSTSVPLL